MRVNTCVNNRLVLFVLSFFFEKISSERNILDITKQKITSRQKLML